MSRLTINPARVDYEKAVTAGQKFAHMDLTELLDAMNTCATLDDYTLKGLEIEIADFRNPDEDDLYDAEISSDAWDSARAVLGQELAVRFGWWYEETRHIEY